MLSAMRDFWYHTGASDLPKDAHQSADDGATRSSPGAWRWPCFAEAAVGGLALVAVASTQPLPMAPAPGSGGRRTSLVPIRPAAQNWDLGQVGDVPVELSVYQDANSVKATFLWDAKRWHHKLTQATSAQQTTFTLAPQYAAGLDILDIGATSMFANGAVSYSLGFDIRPNIYGRIEASRDFGQWIFSGGAFTSAIYTPNDPVQLTLSLNGTGGLSLTVDNSTGALIVSARTRLSSNIEFVTMATSVDRLSAPALAPTPDGQTLPPQAQAPEGGASSASASILSAAIPISSLAIDRTSLQLNTSYSLGQLGDVSLTLDRISRDRVDYLAFGFSCPSWRHRVSLIETSDLQAIALNEGVFAGLSVLGENVTAVAQSQRPLGQKVSVDFARRLFVSLGVYPERNPQDVLFLPLVRASQQAINVEHTATGWRIRLHSGDALLPTRFNLTLPQLEPLSERSQVWHLDQAFADAWTEGLN